MDMNHWSRRSLCDSDPSCFSKLISNVSLNYSTNQDIFQLIWSKKKIQFCSAIYSETHMRFRTFEAFFIGCEKNVKIVKNIT